MKQVLLIHAHKDLDQLNALVGQMAGPQMLVFVNLDAKSAIDPAQVDGRARLIRRRIPIWWADVSQVEATLHSLTEIIAAVPDFDKVIFVSAQDAPLLPNALLLRELEAVRGHELIECTPVGEGGWRCEERFEYYHFPRAGRVKALAARALERAMRLTGLRRPMLHGYRPHGGSSWWALSRACIIEVLAQVAADPALLRYFRHVACGDELFFQTLVMRSPFAGRVLHNNYRYMQWPDGDARNPKILEAADFSSIAESNAHFCRKIDAIASAGLLPLLQHLREDRAAGPGAH
jgi:hypothetical protein